MHKKTKISLILFFLLLFSFFSQTALAKYVMDDINIVAQIDIDRCKPNIELLDIISSQKSHSTDADQNSIISGHIKIVEKNIIKNIFSKDCLKISINGNNVTPDFKSFSLVSENSNEKIYEFSFTNTFEHDPLVLVIPEGIVEDKSRSIK